MTVNDSWFQSALKSQPRKTSPRPSTMKTIPIAAPRRIRSWAPIEPRSTARLSKTFAPPSVCRKSLKSFTEPIRSTSRVLNSMIDFTCCRRSHPLTTVDTIKAIVPKILGTMTTSLPMLVSPVCEENNGWRVEWLTACGERLASHREGLCPLPPGGRLGRRRRRRWFHRHEDGRAACGGRSLLVVVVVVVADNRDEAEHVVVQEMPTVHANHQVAAVLQELNLYPITRGCRGRRSCEEGTGRIGTGRAGVTRRHAGGRCGHSSGCRQKSVGMFRIVDTRVCNDDDVRSSDVETRVDDEIVLRVSDVVVQVLRSGDYNRRAVNRHRRRNGAIAHRSSTTSVGVICTALAKIRSDIVPRGFLAARINRDTVTTAVHDERDRPAFSDGHVIRQQEMGDGGADGGWVRGLRLRLGEMDDRIVKDCFLVFVLVVRSPGCRERYGEGEGCADNDARPSTVHVVAPLPLTITDGSPPTDTK